jgi:hypothetical protein
VTIYYVDSGVSESGDGTTWNGAFQDLAEACSVSESGDEIWCKWCILQPTSPYDIPEGVSVYGGFPNYHQGTSGSKSYRPFRTVIDGQDTYQGVLMQDGSLIDGFLIWQCAATDGAGIGIIGGSSGYYYGDSVLADGDMEDSGTSSWPASNASPSKTSYAAAGDQGLKINATSGYGYVYQSGVTEIGHTYLIAGYRAGNATSVNDGTTAIITFGGFASSYTYFSSFFVATTTQIRMYAYEDTPEIPPNSHYDSVVVKEKIAYSGSIADITISNCEIRDCNATNEGGAIQIKYATGVTLSNLEIHNCTAGVDGGAIHIENECQLEATYLEIYDCSAGADGGGICIAGNSADNDYQFRWCLIHDNSASAASGGVCNKDSASSETRFQNCVISGNTAPSVGGYGHESGVSYLVNCTVADNDDDGVNGDAGTLNVTNCIVWGNDTQIDGGGTIAVTYSNVQDGYAGTGNVTGAPVFGERGRHYYMLDGICDAVDSANSVATHYLGTDPLGHGAYDHPDVSNTGAGAQAYADMGAYEFKGIPNDSLAMSQYFLNMGVSTIDDHIYQYAIVRLPEMPEQWGGHSLVNEPRMVRHQFSSEIEVDDATTVLEERIFIESATIAYRLTDGETYTDPSRDADYAGIYQSTSDTTVAEQKGYPDGIELETNFRYLLVMFSWKPNPDSTYDVCRAYNVDIKQIHDLSYTYGVGQNQTWFGLSPGMHPGGTVFAPDVPVSAWHVRALQDGIAKIIHESVVRQSIPVFGYSRTPVV